MNSNDLSWLAAKQKRLKTWREFAEHEVQDKAIKLQTLSILDKYADCLVQIWKDKSLSEVSQKQISDFERQLEQLNEEARMRVVGTI